jgi:RNA polymerase sigma-70 factor (ECF subfamily)
MLKGDVMIGTDEAIGNSNANSTAAAHDDLPFVHACKAGDVSAFEWLVTRHNARVFSIAQHITHSREDAEEVVQDAFLKAFRNLNQFREDSRFSTWLSRIAVNESLMKLRKQRRHSEVQVDDSPLEEGAATFEVADWAPNPEQLYREQELRNILRSELQELPAGLRVVFVLRDIEGLSTEEAAEVLDSTPVAVKARLWRARLKLRERLNRHFGVVTPCG